MKISLVRFALVAALSVGIVGYAAGADQPAKPKPAPAAPAPKPATTTSTTKPAGKGDAVPLTKDEIDGLKENWEQGDKNLHFYATFEQLLMTQKEKKTSSKEKLRYRVTARLFELKEVNKRISQVDVSGSAHLYILDPDDKVIEKKSPIALSKLSPSAQAATGTAGLTGEVEKAGTYKAIIWIEDPKAGRLGKVITVKIEPPKTN